MMINIESIRLDGGTQPRSALDYGVVGEYAEALQGGAKFPAVTVFYDGTDYWLSDGFHRVTAAVRAGLNEIEADVHQGSRRDAQWHSFSANKSHGLRREKGDAKRAIEKILNDAEWAKVPQTKIAEHVGVSQGYVSQIQAHLISSNKIDRGPVEVNRNGKTYTQNTENIGKRSTPEPEYNFYEAEPDEEAEEDSAEHAIDTTVDYAIDHIWDYIETILSEMPALTDRHAVVNEILKRVRSLSIEYNQQA